MNNELREKFKKLYYEKFNINLTNEEATQMATDLINLMEVLLKPEKSEEFEKESVERSNYAVIPTQQHSQ